MFSHVQKVWIFIFCSSVNEEKEILFVIADSKQNASLLILKMRFNLIILPAC